MKKFEELKKLIEANSIMSGISLDKLLDEKISNEKHLIKNININVPTSISQCDYKIICKITDALSYGELKEFIMLNFNTTESSAKYRIKTLVEKGVLKKNYMRKYEKI
jgi:hypothetical protein